VLLPLSRIVRRIDVGNHQRPDAVNLYDGSSACQGEVVYAAWMTAALPAGSGFVFARFNLSPTPMFRVAVTSMGHPPQTFMRYIRPNDDTARTAIEKMADGLLLMGQPPLSAPGVDSSLRIVSTRTAAG
jgi:hypothetical protein